MRRTYLDAVEGVRIDLAQECGSSPVPIAAFLETVAVEKETAPTNLPQAGWPRMRECAAAVGARVKRLV